MEQNINYFQLKYYSKIIKIKVGKYKLRNYLYSDKRGKIVNSLSKLNINVQIISNYFNDDAINDGILEQFNY